MIPTEQVVPCLPPKEKLRPFGPKVMSKPVAIVLFPVVLAIMLVTASLLIFFNQSARFTVHHLPHPPILVDQNTPATTSTFTPTLVPTPQPIPSLPNTIRGQIADLQAHDRFFYAGNPRLPEIALTFDDGPNPANTPQILAILKKYGVHATFFDLGYLAQIYPKLIRQEIAGGHVVGNHTWSHPFLPYLTPRAIHKQIKDTSDMIERVAGVRPVFFRTPYGAPPFGSSDIDVLKEANRFGLTTVIWNVDPQDWSIPGTAAIIWRVLSSVGNGSIVLMHDGGGNRYQTVAALPTIIEQLRARHFQFVTMAQLVAHYHAHAGTTPSTPTPTSMPPGHRHFFMSTWSARQKRMPRCML